MTYDPTIPHTGQSLGVTRDPIRSNFALIQTAISVDHIPISATGQGRHQQVDLHTYGPFPYTTTLDESILFSYKGTGATPQLCYQPVGSTGVSAVRLPCSPRAMVRANADPASVFSIDTNDGPYGPNTRFNCASISGGGGGTYDLHFSFDSPMINEFYFVFFTAENSYTTGPGFKMPCVGNKTVNGFDILGIYAYSAKITIMVY